MKRTALFGAAFILIAVDARATDSATADECIRAAEEAQPLKAAGRLRAAREQLVVCARSTCPTAVRSDCTEWLLALDVARPSIVVRAVDAAGADLVDVRVIVDGTLLSARLDGTAIPLDPGVHVLRVERAGNAPIQEQLVIRQGEQNRIVSVAFSSPARPRAERSGVPAASWALGGVGTVALAVAGFAWISGRAERADLAASCAPTHACAGGDVDAARTRLIVGDVAFGAGLLALGAAAWFWVSATRAPSDRSNASVHVVRF